MTLGGSVAVVTTALVVAGGASCLSLLNDNLSTRAPIDEGQSVAYKNSICVGNQIQQVGNGGDRLRSTCWVQSRPCERQ